ncbi:hypothetical protein KSP40_PGU016823 [Platanthera guangdongensis]|uniref:Secreted protein n=1 Tax=Platanthera guangdongensis TaxID=2320717 RepID=A0ABR2MVC6_9ASPA
MRCFLIALDIEVWCMIEQRYTPPTTVVGSVTMEKPVTTRIFFAFNQYIKLRKIRVVMSRRARIIEDTQERNQT